MDLKKIPLKDRPREKLVSRGVSVLSDIELLAICLGSGTRNRDVISLSSELLKIIDQDVNNIKLAEIMKIKGIGMAKASLICAAIEFAKRRIHSNGIKILYPKEIFPLIRHYGNKKQEHFIIITINGASELIKSHIISIGLLNKTLVHPREVFVKSIIDRAASIIVAHNHPSGELRPSREDFHITKTLIEAGKIIGIKVMDHIIFNSNDYYSLLENNDI